MLIIIIVSMVMAIVIVNTINFQGYGVAERCFKIMFKEDQCDDSIIETFPFRIYSRRINNFLLILFFLVCTIYLAVIYIQNDFFKLFYYNILISCIYLIPFIILVLIILLNICIFTNKVKIYPDKMICSNMLHRKTFFYKNLDSIELFNYADAYEKLGFYSDKRLQSRHAYHITKNNKVIKKLWGHHYKNLYKLEDYFTTKNPYIKSIKKSKKINEETIMRCPPFC